MTIARVTQAGVEVLLANDPTAQVTQAGVEVLRSTAVAFSASGIVTITVTGGPKKVAS